MRYKVALCCIRFAAWPFSSADKYLKWSHIYLRLFLKRNEFQQTPVHVLMLKFFFKKTHGISMSKMKPSDYKRCIYELFVLRKFRKRSQINRTKANISIASRYKSYLYWLVGETMTCLKIPVQNLSGGEDAHSCFDNVLHHYVHC